jgi:4-hydroxy-3-methylbut-2-enyl diphosphate reductase
MGQTDSGMYFVETAADVERLEVRDPDRLAYVTQTTLSIDDAAAVVAALKRRYPAIAEPKKADICYATQNRQDAVKFMAPRVDVVIVIGSQTSSNSNRLREVAERFNVPAYLVDTAEDLRAEWLSGKRRIGVTAGASAPEVLIERLVARLRELGASSVRPLDGVQENVTFPMPKGLQAPVANEKEAT